MVHATKFLLRWLYLNNLIYDRAEIQSLPFLHPSQINVNEQPHHQQQQQQQQHSMQHSIQHSIQQHPQQQHQSSYNNNKNDYEWKRKALRTITLYPPGTSRLVALDSLRLEIVHELARELHDADQIIQAYTNTNSKNNRKKKISNNNQLDRRKINNHNDDDDDENSTYNNQDILDFDRIGHDEDADDVINNTNDDDDDDVTVDNDNDILKEFQEATSCKMLMDDDNNNGSKKSINSIPLPSDTITKKATTTTTTTTPNLLDPKLKKALELQRETRENLPQFVSAILHSPPPLTSTLGYQAHPQAQQQHQQQNNLRLDPISTLRSLLINRCIRDPNLGIELCWLLEAEVGRTWKLLFEDRQKLHSGQRLILVLPADKAVVIAKIGNEKKSAFDLLQDVESATAYGVCGGLIGSGGGGREEIYTTPKLPASLSMKRCSHFGDTMHFIDRLTQISLDLRLVPLNQRKYYLEESLEELNRRLRRRMVTEGKVSLDVDDNLGPHDWPLLGDISLESLKYSVHFPLEPTGTTWPGKHGPEIFQDSSPLLALKTEHGVMRVLNIVSSKCRILASRERCPFLVHCEVLETGLEGGDARLYANGAEEIGATLQEVMGIASEKKSLHGGETRNHHYSGTFPPYHIPSELSSIDEESTYKQEDRITSAGYEKIDSSTAEKLSHYKAEKLLLRGGDQEGYSYPNIDNSGYLSSSPYDLVQEEQLQRLHEHLQSNQQHPHYGPPQSPQIPYSSEETNRPQLTRYTALLDKVFGSSWSETCEEIRKTSPYGNVKGWRLASFIMKAGEDIRREALVMQVISKMKQWFEQDIPEPNRPYLKPYTILCVGGDAGLLECIRDAKSIDEVKKNADGFTTLREYFERAYGSPMRKGRGTHQPTAFHHQHPLASHQQQMQYQQPSQHPNSYHPMNQIQNQQQQQQQVPDVGSTDSISHSISFETAQDNFLRSLVGYSLICYILQIKDRHNANILLDREGHIMHIDFGFVLGDTPKMGKVPLFNERAPFKLTAEFWDVIGGWNFNNGGLGVKFCKMFEEAFYCAAMHAEELVTLIESAILNLTQNPNVASIVANSVRHRLRMRGERDSVQQKTFIMDLVNTALTSWGTSTYDWLQKSMNGYI